MSINANNLIISLTKRSLYFLSAVVCIFLFIPMSLKAQTETPSDKTATTSTSSSSAILSTAISGKGSAVTLTAIPYQFNVTVTSTFHYVPGTEKDYVTYYAVCPPGSSRIAGSTPNAVTLTPLIVCACTGLFCEPPYVVQVKKGIIRSQVTCLKKDVFTYVLTSLLPATALEPPTKKGYPDDAHPYVYSFDDNPAGPILQKGDYYGSVYNPIRDLHVDPTTGMSFNASRVQGKNPIAKATATSLCGF